MMTDYRLWSSSDGTPFPLPLAHSPLLCLTGPVLRQCRPKACPPRTAPEGSWFGVLFPFILFRLHFLWFLLLSLLFANLSPQESGGNSWWGWYHCQQITLSISRIQFFTQVLDALQTASMILAWWVQHSESQWSSAHPISGTAFLVASSVSVGSGLSQHILCFSW